MRSSPRRLLASLTLVGMVTAVACTTPAPPPPAKPSGDAAFGEVARAYLEDTYRRQPSLATLLGVHRYDEKLDDQSRQAVMNEIAAARQFRDRVAAIDAASLSADRQLDREQLLHAIDSRLITLDVIRPWAKDPDIYSSGVTNTAYMMIKRKFAPRRRAAAAAGRARESDAGRAGRGAQEPREPAPDLHARSRSSSSTATASSSRRPSPRRSPSVKDRRSWPSSSRPTTPSSPRWRLQEVAAGRSAEAIDRRVRLRRRHVSQEARRPTR